MYSAFFNFDCGHLVNCSRLWEREIVPLNASTVYMPLSLFVCL
uniref:Uncharacterized protein n=1 Tax=Arundo donax TaxID=35708 RepID=A0A0A9DWG0_ARUDO